MIDWAKIVESHVIRIFRKTCYEWWGIDVRFYDEHGNHRNTNIFFHNPFCNVMNLMPKGAKCCSQTYLKNLKKFRENPEPFFYQCFAGFQGIAVPILVKQKYVGCMIGSGICLFAKDDPLQKKYKEALGELGFDRTILDSCYEKMKTIDQHKKEIL